MESRAMMSYGQCRCCLSKGKHRDIMKEYYYNDVREVYLDIFLECFNLFLSTDAHISTLICSTCVQRLRDANSFKMMVINTERQLLGTLDDKHTVFVNVQADIDGDVKTEEQLIVKEEPAYSENDVEYDSDRETSDIQCDAFKPEDELVEGEAALLARFPRETLKPLPTRNTLYTTCANYVNHLDSIKGKLILPTMIEKILKESQNKRRLSRGRNIYITEKLAHIQNVTTLLEFSNVTPFKTKTRSGFPCFYCRSIYDNLETLREHQTKHNKAGIKKILSKYGAECIVVYADVTDLKCIICNEGISTLNALKSHLTNTHKKKLHPEFTDRVIPFKLSENNDHRCQICGFSFETFGSIERHMNIHYRNYVCEECGAGFVTKHRLKVHIYSLHVCGRFPCNICKKVYTTHQKYKTHVDAVHRMVKKNKCPKCSERFADYFGRQKHMVEVHGVAPLQYKCNVCDKVFNRRYALSCHMKRSHLEERDIQCQLCVYKCYTKSELKVHMIKHNGERMFECSVCKKSYARKKTLKEHLRIHNNDRRFSCAICGQSFVQKCSLKGHVKTHHTEYINGLH